MKMLVFSDSHGDIGNVIKVVNMHKNIDGIIHLGDHTRDARDIECIFPDIEVKYVRGNCDYDDPYTKDVEIFEWMGYRIMYTHGHLHHVKYDYQQIYEFGIANEIDVLLFGHTHIPFKDQYKNMWIMNPGSISGIRSQNGGTFGILEIDSKKNLHVTLSGKTL